MKKKPNPFGDDYELVPDTVGRITDSVWIKKDGSEMIIKFAWGGNLRHKPINQHGI